MLFSEVSPSGELQYQVVGKGTHRLDQDGTGSFWWFGLGRLANPPERIFSHPNRLRGREARLDDFSSMAPNRQLFFFFFKAFECTFCYHFFVF